jgi:hypothetical protein
LDNHRAGQERHHAVVALGILIACALLGEEGAQVRFERVQSARP